MNYLNFLHVVVCFAFGFIAGFKNWKLMILFIMHGILMGAGH